MWAYVHGNIFVVVAEGGATCQWEELISFFVGISDVNNNTEPFRAGPIHDLSADTISPDVENTRSEATDVACITKYLVPNTDKLGNVSIMEINLYEAHSNVKYCLYSK